MLVIIAVLSPIFDLPEFVFNEYHHWLRGCSSFTLCKMTSLGILFGNSQNVCSKSEVHYRYMGIGLAFDRHFALSARDSLE